MVPRTAKALTLAIAIAVAIAAWGVSSAQADTTVFRVNAGGAALAGTPGWSVDTVATPSPYVNAVATKNLTSSSSAAVNLTDPSVPAGTPAALLQTTRWDPIGRSELQWSFPAPVGPYQIRLYFAETYAPNFATGVRVFDVLLDNQVVLDHFDIYAAAGGGNRAIVKTINATSDGSLDLTFRHEVGDPQINGIEVISLSNTPPPEGVLSASPSPLAFGTVTTGSTGSLNVQLSNTAAAGSGSVTVNSTAIAGTDASQFSDTFDDTTPVTLAPGQSTTVTTRFSPTSAGAKSATLQITRAGSATPLTVALTGTGQDPAPPDGVLSVVPTSLAFGTVTTGSTGSLGVQLSNTAAAGSGSVTVNSTAIAGTDASQFSDTFDDTTPVTLAPGQSTTVTTRFSPTSAGAKSATLQITRAGSATPLTVALTGTGQDPPPPGGGSWTTGAAMPRDIGEVSSGVIGTRMYLVGDNNDDTRTLAYNLASNTWVQNLPVRPFLGSHHAAEVINGQWYLFGGDGAGGRVQIYNPTTNTWRSGATIPVSSGSAATALINGKVYYAGGESASTTAGAVYDPVADSWSAIASMPRGVTHAAAGTDGQKLWVFGGRGGNTSGSSASNLVQVYDPATNTWTSSATNSALAPFPVARGGMGKAVYLNGRFYMMGGEDLANVGGTVTGNVYNRVDIYTVATNSWSLGTPMITARHGIFPSLYQGKIYVAGGGIHSLHSSSTILETYTPGS